MGIQIKEVQIKNFRSHNNSYARLEPLTLLVGANNAGKTSFLRALSIALNSDRKFVNKDDLFINSEGSIGEDETIQIDIKITPTSKDEKFDELWAFAFGTDIKVDSESKEFLAFSTQINFETGNQEAQVKRYVIIDWDSNKIDDTTELSAKTYFIPLYFIDAQRDLQEDLKAATSYFGRLAKQIEYNKEDLKEIQDALQKVNNDAVSKSKVLKHLKDSLTELNKTVQSKGNGVEITPLPKKLRDLHKGIKVHFQDGTSDSFSLEYHGMGTRSWASLLAFKAFINWEYDLNTEANDPFYPILALEEPESHLHPHAQRQLYSQLKSIPGQKIISTHSPYVIAQSSIEEIRLFFKEADQTMVNEIDLGYQRKIKSLMADREKFSASRSRVNSITEEIELTKLREREALRRIRAEILSSKGEILFSKYVVLFEGFTEEQVFPIFGKEYWGQYPSELGVSFVNVQGKSNYFPYLNLLESCKIPWLIFSDSELQTVAEVKNQIVQAFGEVRPDQAIFLPLGQDFEAYLISEYEKEMRQAIAKYESFYSESPEHVKAMEKLWLESKTVDEISKYLENNKTNIAPFYASEIVRLNQIHLRIPERLITVFEKINSLLKIESKYMKYRLLLELVNNLRNCKGNE